MLLCQNDGFFVRKKCVLSKHMFFVTINIVSLRKQYLLVPKNVFCLKVFCVDTKKYCFGLHTIFLSIKKLLLPKKTKCVKFLRGVPFPRGALHSPRFQARSCAGPPTLPARRRRPPARARKQRRWRDDLSSVGRAGGDFVECTILVCLLW